MTGYREQAYLLIEQALHVNDGLKEKMSGYAPESDMQQMLRRERLEIIDRMVNLASLDGLAEPPHPPVPEQASTPQQAGWIEQNMFLWAGWQPGYWPALDNGDQRGFRWEAMPS